MPRRLRASLKFGRLRARRPRRRLFVEHLEDRTLLAVLTVDTALDDNNPSDPTLSLREAIELNNGTLAPSALSAEAQSYINGTPNGGGADSINFDIPNATTTTFPVPNPPGSTNGGITAGPDGNVWFVAQGFNGTSAIGRITPTGTITLFPIANPAAQPDEITAGPDGNLWFTDPGDNAIGRVTTSGTVTEFPNTSNGGAPTGITSGPDGALYFTETNSGEIGRITTAGVVTNQFPVGGSPQIITLGSDGNLWYEDSSASQISRFNIASDTVTPFAIPSGNTPGFITSGPDGALWFTETPSGSGTNDLRIGRVTTGGSVTEFPDTVPNSDPLAITTGPDGALWFTDSETDALGRITTGGVLTEYPVPIAVPLQLTTGGDGNLWFGDFSQTIGRLDPVAQATITPTTALPPITHPMEIFGPTQPGSAGTPVIQLSGNNNTNIAYGLEIAAGGDTSLISGLDIAAFTGGPGIEIDQASNTTIFGNFIGTDLTGTMALGNGVGIAILGGTGNTIGTTGGSITADGNVISGNDGGDGIFIGSGASNNLIEGNYIGTDVTGAVAIGNGLEGVMIAASGNTVGGTTAGARNVISGNTEAGVESGGPNNVIEGNYIGTDVSGTQALGNHADGVGLENPVSNNTVGGAAAGAGNTIAFNGNVGVSVGFAAFNTNVDDAILGNDIFSNSHGGIALGPVGVTMNTPGGPHSGPNLMQNFPVLASATFLATSTLVSGSLNSDPNTTFIVQLFANLAADPSGFGQGQTFLGQTTVTTDSSGNATFNASVAAVPSGEQVITATATDPNGNTSEFSQALVIQAVTSTTDSGPGSLRQAILTANAGQARQAITFDFAGTGVQTFFLMTPLPAITVPVVIDGTSQPGFAGTPIVAIDGSMAGEGADGLQIAATAGASTVEGLVIDNFQGAGIDDEASDVQIIGNFIGVDPTGTMPAPNGAGILISGSANTVGGSTAADANVISGNTGAGIEVSGAAATANLIEGNSIGTDATGTLALGNGGDGVLLTDASANTIELNTIANNADDGVKVDGGTGNSILTNSLFSDARLEIELTNGGNDNQPPPVLTGATTTDTSTTITGTIQAAPNTSYLIQFFSSPATTLLGFGEARTFLDQTTVTTDASGSAAVDDTISLVVPADQLISATATVILADLTPDLQFVGAPTPVTMSKTGDTSVISNAANPTRTPQTLPYVSINASPTIVTASSIGTETVTFTVTLTTSSDQAVIVPYTTTGYTVAPGPVDFIPPLSGSPIQQTFSVTIAAETPDDPIQTFTVNLGQPTNAILDTTAAVAAISIYPSPSPTPHSHRPPRHPRPPPHRTHPLPLRHPPSPLPLRHRLPPRPHRPHRRSRPACFSAPAKGGRRLTRTGFSSAPRSTPPRRRVSVITRSRRESPRRRWRGFASWRRSTTRGTTRSRSLSENRRRARRFPSRSRACRAPAARRWGRLSRTSEPRRSGSLDIG